MTLLRRHVKIRAVNTTASLSDLYLTIAAPLEAVRETMATVWGDALRLVRVEIEHTPQLGGKMLRPALCLLSAGAVGERDLQRFVPLAAAYECIHIASLTHDDVIDRALLRRGASSLNALWDNHAAVLGGDYLVARAVEMLAVYDSCPIIVNAITCVRLMAEGELLFFGRPAAAITEEDCLQLAQQKTASLFAQACSAPATARGNFYGEHLYRYGLHLGTAFQLIDDLLDLTQDETQMGKPACGDVAEGKITIPILYLREQLPPAELERLESFAQSGLRDEDRLWVRQRLEETGAEEKCRALIQHYSDSALDAVQRLPASAFREALESLIDLLARRTG